MMKILAMLMLAGSVAHAADIPVMNVPTVNQRMKSARTAIAQSDWRTARFETQKVVDEEPSNADDHTLLILAQLK